MDNDYNRMFAESEDFVSLNEQEVNSHPDSHKTYRKFKTYRIISNVLFATGLTGLAIYSGIKGDNEGIAASLGFLAAYSAYKLRKK